MFVLVLAGCSSVEKFEYPDIKDDFCGVHINYQYCKCAFHDDFCEQIGMDQDSADDHVQSEYDKWVSDKLNDWLAACGIAGGIPGVDDCTYCDEGTVPKDGKCVSLEDMGDDEDDEESEFVPDRPLRKDCTVDPAEFNANWQKYSDIDDAIPFNDRSYEAKGALTAYDQMIEKMVEAFALERDIEIEKQMQAELEEYKSLLVQNIKTNLLKAFWRLSWVTYTTVKSGTGLGESYSQVLTSGAGVETVGAGLKVVQGLIPSSSQLAINTSSVSGKAKSIGANAALEAIDSLGDPTKIATEIFKSASGAALPSADISQEEINILREQHLKNGIIDQALKDSRTANAEREAKLAQLEVEIKQLQQDITEWEGKEKERVKSALESSCEKLKEQYEKNNK
ncbi:hypothetical protein ACFL6I_13900 [candidate division KSB1 bacterium]